MLLIADTSPVISLFLTKKFALLEKLFPGYIIPEAVFEELNKHNEIKNYTQELKILSKKARKVNSFFSLSGIDIGETEAIILYKETNANLLLIDDKKAREKAELLNINCIGTLGLLYLAWQKNQIQELRPLFLDLLKRKRYFSKQYMNIFLSKTGEEKL